MNRRRLLARWMALGVLVAGCSSETVGMWPAAPTQFMTTPGVAPAPSPTTPTDMERGAADAYTNALESPGFVDLGSLLQEQAQFAFDGRSTHGRERVLKAHEDMFGAFDERRFVTSRLWLTDSTRPLDSQAIEWTMTGVQARAFMGIAPTGRSVVIRGLTLLWTNDDGIISELHVYFDEAVVRAQLQRSPVELREGRTAQPSSVTVSDPAAVQKVAAPSPDGDARPVFERSGTPEESANVAVMRTMIQSLEDDKEAEFLSTMNEDVEVFTLDRAEPTRGKNAAREYFRTMRRSIRLLDTVIRNAWGVRTFAVTEYVVTGLERAPLPGVAFAEGRPIHARFVDIAEFKDGRIARISRYADPTSFASL